MLEVSFLLVVPAPVPPLRAVLISRNRLLTNPIPGQRYRPPFPSLSLLIYPADPEQPTSTATKKPTTDSSSPFVKQYTFHIDPSSDEHVLMTNDLSAKLAAVNRNQMDEKSRENSATTKSTGSPRSGSPGSNPPLRGIEDIWKGDAAGSPPKGTERRHNGICLIFCAVVLQ